MDAASRVPRLSGMSAGTNPTRRDERKKPRAPLCFWWRKIGFFAPLAAAKGIFCLTFRFLDRMKCVRLINYISCTI